MGVSEVKAVACLAVPLSHSLGNLALKTSPKFEREEDEEMLEECPPEGERNFDGGERAGK